VEVSATTDDVGVVMYAAVTTTDDVRDFTVVDHRRKSKKNKGNNNLWKKNQLPHNRKTNNSSTSLRQRTTIGKVKTALPRLVPETEEGNAVVVPTPPQQETTPTPPPQEKTTTPTPTPPPPQKEITSARQERTTTTNAPPPPPPPPQKETTPTPPPQKETITVPPPPPPPPQKETISRRNRFPQKKTNNTTNGCQNGCISKDIMPYGILKCRQTKNSLVTEVVFESIDMVLRNKETMYMIDVMTSFNLCGLSGCQKCSQVMNFRKDLYRICPQNACKELLLCHCAECFRKFLFLHTVNNGLSVPTFKDLRISVGRCIFEYSSEELMGKMQSTIF
jgi:hypothetical protein